MRRIIEIASTPRHLSRYRGFMCIEEEGKELARIPLDSIGALIITGYGVTYSHSLFLALCEAGAVVVLCDARHQPAGLLYPFEGHYQQSGRMDLQIEASKPFYKGIWQDIVKVKITQQAGVLRTHGGEDVLSPLVAKVLSGDPKNVEAWASRLYFPLLFGGDFRRDRQLEGVNSLLNYGYMVVRACVARYVVASGLSPALGIHHKNKLNSMRLVDDLMEPFRPFVDHVVKNIIDQEEGVLTPKVKQSLCAVLEIKILTEGGELTCDKAIEALVLSLVACLEKRRKKLIFPLDKTWDKRLL